GPDFFTQIQSAAVDVAGLAGSVVTDNHISGSDIRFMREVPRIKCSGTTVSDTKYAGVAFVDVDAYTSKNVISASPVGILVAAIAKETTGLPMGSHHTQTTK